MCEMYVIGHIFCKIDWLFALTRYVLGPKGDNRDYFEIKFEHYC